MREIDLDDRANTSRRQAPSGQWEASSGNWRAVVVRLSDDGHWYPYVEQINLPHERRDGPTCAWAMDGRAWCEAEIKRLQGAS